MRVIGCIQPFSSPPFLSFLDPVCHSEKESKIVSPVAFCFLPPSQPDSQPCKSLSHMKISYFDRTLNSIAGLAAIRLCFMRGCGINSVSLFHTFVSFFFLSSLYPTILCLSPFFHQHNMVLQTKLTKLVGIKHPIVQGGMQWVSVVLHFFIPPRIHNRQQQEAIHSPALYAQEHQQRLPPSRLSFTSFSIVVKGDCQGDIDRDILSIEEKKTKEGTLERVYRGRTYFKTGQLVPFSFFSRAGGGIPGTTRKREAILSRLGFTDRSFVFILLSLLFWRLFANTPFLLARFATHRARWNSRCSAFPLIQL